MSAHEYDVRDRDRELRRLAIQLAGQLPADTHDAMTVLRHCRTLVEFMGEQAAPCVGVSNVSNVTRMVGTGQRN